MTIDYTMLPFHWTGDAWILPDEERRVNTLDDYWDEPPRPERPADRSGARAGGGTPSWRHAKWMLRCGSSRPRSL